MPESTVQAGLDRSPARVLGWGAYLACSWTWCIGMFLPILLWRDFGPWALLAFALPNIVGAAEMGFVLAKPGSSERFVASHAIACRAFGVVTVAFQAFFLVWLTRMLGAPEWFTAAGVAAAGVLALGWFGVRSGDWRGEAPVAWLASIGLAAWFVYRRGGLDWPAAITPATVPLDLAALAGVCVLGFVFCPYLDLTFHKARQRTTPTAGKLAFAIGFGVLFAAMIAFTAVYAVALLRPDLGEPGSLAGRLGIGIVAAHIGMQLLFTIGVHGSELRTGRNGRVRPDWALIAAVGVACGLGLATGWPGYAGLTFGEVVYRLFMAFYGLVFPAYVLICATPIARTGPPTRRMLVAFAAAVAIASPFYWMGFIEREAWWLLIGVGIVIASRFVRGPRGGEGSSAPPRRLGSTASPVSGCSPASSARP